MASPQTRFVIINSIRLCHSLSRGSAGSTKLNPLCQLFGRWLPNRKNYSKMTPALSQHSRQSVRCIRASWQCCVRSPLPGLDGT